MNAILSLGEFRLLAVGDTVGDILIEVHQVLSPDQINQLCKEGKVNSIRS